MKPKTFESAIQDAPAPIRDAWQVACEHPRALFDASSAQWHLINMDHRVSLLRLVDEAGMLDTIVRDYIDEHRGVGRHVLAGLPAAMGECAAWGYDLKLPINPWMGSTEAVIHVTGLIAALYDKEFASEHHDFLVNQLKRLRSTVTHWLERDRRCG